MSPISHLSTAAMAVRPATPADAAALRAFHAALSTRTRAQRYFSPLRDLPHSLMAALVSGDPVHRFFVVQDADAASIVGLGQYAIDVQQRRCEVALVIADAWQRCGLGARLLSALLGDATAAGLTEAHLETERSNLAMHALARRAGFAVCGHPSDSTLLMARRSLGIARVMPWQSIRNRSALAQDLARAAA